MPKSNYPDKLDTSVEIPVVRDNITEIGSDVLNSLRSAIFNIEKALGINPQGAIGNTVAARLSNALDENGNILKEALDRSNVLSGPITDVDVSKAAAINESKLRLNYPTDLLQDQLSILNNKLASFILTLEELNAMLSAHIHEDATNRHYAQAITVLEAEVDGSATSSLSLEEGTLQDILEEIYNAHMNYTGEGIDTDNNSHIAGQIYYDNEETSDLISSASVQGAIDDLAATEGAGLRSSNLNFNSNGIIRTGSAYNAFEAFDIGSTLVEASEITYSGPYGASTLKISFPDAPTPTSALEPFDVLTIIDAPDEDDNAEYIISYVDLTADGDLHYVIVFGGPKNPITIGTTAKITKNLFINYNENGLNCAVRPRFLHSNTPDIQAALPNAATIISSGIRPTSLEADSLDMISIEIDGGTAVEIPVYDEDFDNQSIDTVVNKVNQYIVANKLNIFAYKVRSLRCFELAITHILPSFEGDSQNRTLKLVEPSASDASEVLGLSYLLDREVEGTGGNAYHINGRLLEDFGNITTYTSDSIFINTGTMTLDAVSGDFIVDGLRAGDLCVIEGSSESDDDGTYRINAIDNELLTLDSVGSALQGELSDDSAVYIIRCTAPIGEMEFVSVGDGLIMFDVFVDQNKGIFYKKRMDMVGHLISGGFHGIVSDVSSWFIREGEEYVLTVDADGLATLESFPGGSLGEAAFVGATGVYKVFSADGMAYVVLEIHATGNPDLPIETKLTGSAVLPSNVLHLCRGVYSTKFGFVLSVESSATGSYGVPRVIDKRSTGTVDDTIVGEALLERYIQGPRNELRSSGVIRDASVDSVLVSDYSTGLCAITINPGVVIVNGVRFEYLGVTDLVYKFDDGDGTDHFYIALDGNGCVVVGMEIDPAGGSDYISPFAEQTVAHLAYVNPHSTDPESTTIDDLRLFVDHIDYKLLGDITVATDQRFGHFTDIQSAVNYAERFSALFPDMGTPSILIKEGTHELSENLYLNFDVKISGVGPQTIIKRSTDFPLDEPLLGNSDKDDAMILVSTNAESPRVIYGITIENMTFVGSEGEAVYDGGGHFIMVRHNTDNNANTASFIFDKLRFIAASDYVISDNILLSTASTGPNQMPFHIGYSSGGIFKNYTISNCFFDGVGWAHGVIYLNGGNEYQNLSVINNTSINSIDEAEGYTLIYDPGINTFINVQEINSMIIGTGGKGSGGYSS